MGHRGGTAGDQRSRGADPMRECECERVPVDETTRIACAASGVHSPFVVL
jgi:hypothetical protein